MSFYEILQEIMDEKGLTIPETARLCGLQDSTIRSIITRKNEKVALSVAFKLSTGLGVSLERLNGIEEKKSAPSAEDDAMLQYFHQLNEEGQEQVLNYARLLVNSNEYKKYDPAQLGQEA